ncbi:MAG: N-acetyl-alpha-D-glucosaminyl L-malate synthase BshA [Planctomycetes bacterium]|nr:N-acetyl-alpha-D-glucosaminyl L-malate synthase BshA [Planctomycetota bacterium]
MKLAIVCYPTYGGSGVVATELAMHLADRGHDVHMVSYEIPFRMDRFRPNLMFHAVDVGDYPLFRYPPYTLNLTNKLIEVVEEHGVEIIHSHYAIPHAASAWMARQVLREKEPRKDVKLACTLHGTDITLVGRERGFYELTRFAMNHQDLLTTPSAWLSAETDRHFGTKPGTVRAIPNFVDLERFKPDPTKAARQCLAPDDYKVITHVSNFRPVKRVDEVVRAFAVLRRHHKAVLALVGDGPELPKAEHLARELGVRGDLRILGQQKPEPILQASDLFLLPSRAESFGLSALEAMACGCPVLGYAAGGLPEVVEDGVTGLLCPEGSDLCLGTLAAGLLSDEPRYQAMRLAARARAELFAAGPIVDQYERALLALLVQQSASAG